MSEPAPQQRIRRLAVEALSVTVGVLLAFSVDAWWDRVQQRDVVDGLRRAAAVEAASNRRLLESYRGAGQRSITAGRELVRLIGPEPEVVPLDSVLGLMGMLLSYEAAPLEFAATDRLLASGDVEVLLDRQFHDDLLTLRTTATRYMDQGVRFDQVHEELVRTFGSVAPMGALSASKEGVHPPSDFPVDVIVVLSSARLEGAVGNLSVWVDNLNRRLEQIVSLSDSAWADERSR